MNEALKKTPLYEAHVAAGARLVPFAGYSMPVQYTGVIEEHQAVRTAVGLFDVSHMGEVEMTGPRAIEVANRIISNDLDRLVAGQALYSVMCKPDGGIVDDIVVYKMGPETVFICVNASNREKDFAWIKEQAKGDCTVTDQSDRWAQIAVQGPKGPELVQRLTNTDVQPLKNYTFARGAVAGVEGVIISRTGYTGEDGFELYVPAGDAKKVWDALLDKGADLGVKPAGLGARDSLRLEMKFALYGNDIDETTNPIEAGLGWVVKLDKKNNFVSQEKLNEIKTKGPARKLVGFEMIERGIARHGYAVLLDKQPIGQVTSGTMGPTINKAVGMAYVPAQYAEVGTELDIDIRGKTAKARVVKTPFYKRS